MLSPALYRQIVDAAYEGVWLVDSEARTTFVNGRTAELLGYAPDEMIGRSLFDFMDPAERPLAEEHLLRRKQRISEQHEFRFRRKDGKELWTMVAASPLLDDAGQVVGALGLLTDITRMKEVEATLGRSETELRALFDGAAIGIALVDAQGRSVRSNPALQRMLGYSAEELREMPFSRFTHPDDVAKDVEQLERMARGEISWYQLEKRFIQRDGRIMWGRLTASVTQPSSGGPVLGIGMVEDITDKKRLEAQFYGAQRMESLGTLAGGIAHDFNNILSAILVNVTLAAHELSADHRAHLALAEIEQASKRASALVRQILTFSQRGSPERRRMQLESAAEEALNLLRATLPASIRIQTSFASDAPEIFADATQVHQVVMNLGTNAAHAMAERGGVLQIRSEPATASEPLNGVHGPIPPGSYARLVVADSGAGMDAETQSRIFDPFFTTKGPGKGSGLGLAVVHGVMRAHGGGIVLASAPGQGTRFELYFPAARAADAGRWAASSRPTSRGKGQRVLCVDDEGAIVRATTLLLRGIGYDAVGFTDPRQALDAVAVSPESFQVVLSDCSMPVIWGIDFVRELRRLRSDLPIVMTSGLIDASLQSSLQELGVREFVPKPATLDELSAAIARALERSS